MANPPPLLPAVVLRRVIRVARFHGISILVVTGLFALGAAALGDFKSALICVIITAAGVFEVHGAGLLANGQARGIDWLVRSHLYLLTVVLGYVGWQLLTYNPAQARHVLDPVMQSPEMQAQLEAIGASPDDLNQMIGMTYFAGYGLTALVSLLYMGGLALYYHRKRSVVTAALEQHRD